MIESTASRAEQDLQTPDEHPLEPKLGGEQIEQHVSENTRSRVVFQAAGTSWYNSPSRNHGVLISTSVQAMVPPSAPPASIPGSSPESNSVGTAVPVQTIPGSPILQGHPGDATDVTTLAELASVSGTDTGQPVLAELATATDGTSAEQSVLAESRAGTADGTDDELSPGGHGGGGGQGYCLTKRNL